MAPRGQSTEQRRGRTKKRPPFHLQIYKEGENSMSPRHQSSKDCQKKTPQEAGPRRPNKRTAYITGDLQLGLHITSIILFTLLLVSSKTALNDLSIYVCTSCTSTNDMQTLFLIAYGKKQINFAVIMFLLCEAGNFSIHVALSDLRRNGSKTCKIPYPTKNPFTWLFFFVSCPNYTYEDKVILINRDINANAVTRNIFNFLGQNRWGPGSVSLS
uniref:3-oxo-5-alpha-steroid 4-dehydrogenase C-terminal domain-containing protein n=1 Tax=Junco hyemalis TaxID=40217 RepID=A0A8C5ICL6_JUNHY